MSKGPITAQEADAMEALQRAGSSVAMIARETGRADSAVRRILNLRGVQWKPIPKEYSEAEDQAIIASLVNGICQVQIAEDVLSHRSLNSIKHRITVLRAQGLIPVSRSNWVKKPVPQSKEYSASGVPIPFDPSERQRVAKGSRKLLIAYHRYFERHVQGRAA